jgi:hypothetical protein
MLALLLLATLPAAALNASHGSVSSSPKLVATQVCTCATQASGSSSTVSELRGHGPPNQVNYDEQLGITFAQSFTSLEYNVTAVVQTDPALDTGPVYLLNGLSDNGFWYQVGVSWNWGPGQTPGTGFAMNYEVFDPYGNSIFPTNGGGLTAFSRSVNPGDTVALNLYFDSSGQVVMLAEDLNTGAYAQQVFSAEGGTYFAGLPNSVANSNGFFTGLMTEWYHGAPYYANLQETVYSTNLTISSGWMWMDEFNGNNDRLVFAGNSTSPSSFTANPNQLQEFDYNGTTEYASGVEFVTGALNGTTTTTSTTATSTTTTTSETPPVSLTFSYSVAGGGVGYGAPILTYVSRGVQEEVSLTTSPTTYGLDAGTQWSVSSALSGSTSSERWVTNETTLGTATNSQTITVEYQHQFNVTIEPNVVSGGSVTPASSGWYDAGAGLTLTATPVSGWAFEGWTIDGQSLAPSSGTSIVVAVEQPINATAVFYPGLEITTAGSVSVAFSYPVSQGTVSGAVQGTVRPGSTDEVYVPPASSVMLEAIPTSFLYSFAGWLGLQTSAGTLVFTMSSPSSLTAESGLNYLNIGILVFALALVASLALLLVTRRNRPAAAAPMESQTGASAGDIQPQPDSPDTGAQ